MVTSDRASLLALKQGDVHYRKISCYANTTV